MAIIEHAALIDRAEKAEAALKEAVTVIGHTARAQGYAEAEVERLRRGILDEIDVGAVCSCACRVNLQRLLNGGSK